MCPIKYQVYLLRRMRQKLIKSKSYIVSKLFVFKTKCNTFVLYFINLYFRLDVLILFLADHKCHGYDYILTFKFITKYIGSCMYYGLLS